MADNVDTSVRMPLNEMEVRDSSLKQTPNNSFGQMMRSGMAGTVNTINRQLSSAGYMIPGAAVVGAAVNGMGNMHDASGTTASGVGMGLGGGGSVGGMGRIAGRGAIAAGGNVGTLGGSGLGGMGDVGTQLSGRGTESAELMAATQQMTEMNQVFNLQYLGLQENMQKENREFSAVSNVMKAKNDTAKNSLSNLK